MPFISPRIPALLFIVAFFLYFAHAGIGAYFTGDDLMNIQHMHGYFTTPLWRALVDVVNPVTSSYRPMGGLFYRVLYAVAGFHPLPFRLACFALLIANLLLAYRLLRLLAGSVAAALLGTLLLAYHAEMYGLYFNSGTIYDILCFTFVTLALTLYVSCRRKGGGLSLPAWLGLAALDLAALQSKEMAWMLPAVLLLYELFYGERSRRGPVRRFAPAALTGLLTLLPLSPRILGPTGLTSSPFYHPTLTVAYFLENCARYWGLMFYAPGRFSVAGMLVMWFAMALAAALLRNRAMAFGLLFWIVTVFPVAVIPGRDGFVLYLPALGLALYGGALLKSVPARPFIVAVCAVLCLAVAHSRMQSVAAGAIHVQRETRDLAEQVRRLHPTLSPKAHVLFVEAPFDDDWILGFLFRLMYNDPGIWVDRAVSRPHVQPYQYVFRYANGKLEELPPRLAPCTPQTLTGEADDSSPLLCWTGDWFSERFPQAVQGTLTHAADAGATVTVAFHGAALEYVCTKAFNRGMAEMTIDGLGRGTLDLYAAQPEFQATFRFDHLAPGDHTAILRVLGRHNAAALDSIVDVDAFRAR